MADVVRDRGYDATNKTWHWHVEHLPVEPTVVHVALGCHAGPRCRLLQAGLLQLEPESSCMLQVDP